MTKAPSVRRPTTVTTLGALLVGAGLAAPGILTLDIEAGWQRTLSPLGLLVPVPRELAGVSSIAPGGLIAMSWLGAAITVLCGVGILRGRAWARRLYIGSCAAEIVLAGLFLASWLVVLPDLVVTCVVAAVLFADREQAYFSSPATPHAASRRANRRAPSSDARSVERPRPRHSAIPGLSPRQMVGIVLVASLAGALALLALRGPELLASRSLTTRVDAACSEAGALCLAAGDVAISLGETTAPSLWNRTQIDGRPGFEVHHWGDEYHRIRWSMPVGESLRGGFFTDLGDSTAREDQAILSIDGPGVECVVAGGEARLRGVAGDGPNALSGAEIEFEAQCAQGRPPLRGSARLGTSLTRTVSTVTAAIEADDRPVPRHGLIASDPPELTIHRELLNALCPPYSGSSLCAFGEDGLEVVHQTSYLFRTDAESVFETTYGPKTLTITHQGDEPVTFELELAEKDLLWPGYHAGIDRKLPRLSLHGDLVRPMGSMAFVIEELERRDDGSLDRLALSFLIHPRSEKVILRHVEKEPRQIIGRLCLRCTSDIWHAPGQGASGSIHEPPVEWYSMKRLVNLRLESFDKVCPDRAGSQWCVLGKYRPQFWVGPADRGALSAEILSVDGRERLVLQAMVEGQHQWLELYTSGPDRSLSAKAYGYQVSLVDRAGDGCRQPAGSRFHIHRLRRHPDGRVADLDVTYWFQCSYEEAGRIIFRDDDPAREP